MPHVVTARCIDCRYTDCCEVCPVQAFHELEDPKMLVIDPATCIDCMLCVPECPINAIYEAEELPEHYKDWQDLNAQLFEYGTNITKKGDKAATRCAPGRPRPAGPTSSRATPPTRAPSRRPGPGRAAARR